MKISLVQQFISWENKSKNLINAEKKIKQYANEGCDLVLFPEMSFTGFSMNTNVTGETDGYTVNLISKMAKNYGVSVGFGWVDNESSKSKNRYSIIDKKGDVVSSYVKIHPFSYSNEDKKFIGGNDLSIFRIDNIPFSTFICYDLRFPELFRAVADKVHAIIIPACWPATRSSHWKSLLKARAIENQVYIFAVNCYGNIGGLYYSGDSCVINPNGEIIEILSDKEGEIVFDFLDDVEIKRSSFPVFNDRRKDLYQKFYNNL